MVVVIVIMLLRGLVRISPVLAHMAWARREARSMAVTETIERTTKGGSKDGGGRASHGGRGGGSPLERVTVNLAPRASEALEQLAQITGESKTDTINKALQVFSYLQQLQRDGGAIYVRESGSKEVERLKIF
jgi:hypothetical protein